MITPASGNMNATMRGGVRGAVPAAKPPKVKALPTPKLPAIHSPYRSARLPSVKL